MTFVRKHWLKILVVSGLVILAIAMPFVILIAVEMHSYHQWNTKRLPFEQAAWKANPDSREMDPVRLRMVNDLLARPPSTRQKRRPYHQDDQQCAEAVLHPAILPAHQIESPR